jgi:hypothetical protein
MANTFKRYKAVATTSDSTLYTVPSGTTTVIIGATAANINASTQVDITVKHGTNFIVKDVPIPIGATLGFLEGKLVAEAADTIVLSASHASSVDVILSIMEIT